MVSYVRTGQCPGTAGSDIPCERVSTAGIEVMPTARVQAKANDLAETRLLREGGARECPREQRNWLGHKVNREPFVYGEGLLFN